MIDYTEIRTKIKSTLESLGLFWVIYPSGHITESDCDRYIENNTIRNSRQVGKTETQKIYKDLKYQYPDAEILASTEFSDKHKQIFATLVEEYSIQDEKLTKEQIAGALEQAIKCGDFQKHCYAAPNGIDRGSIVTYIPYRNEFKLQNQVRLARELLESAAKAIDDLLIFAHQHTEIPLLKEITIKNRIKEFLDKKQNLF